MIKFNIDSYNKNELENIFGRTLVKIRRMQLKTPETRNLLHTLVQDVSKNLFPKKCALSFSVFKFLNDIFREEKKVSLSVDGASAGDNKIRFHYFNKLLTCQQQFFNRNKYQTEY